MQLPRNPFKARLHETTYGLWNGLQGEYAAEICAGAGYDWVVLDGEHAPFDLRDMIRHLQVISGYPGVGALVRPASGDPVVIKRLLDVGVQSLLIPMVDTAAEAEELVRAMRYPPRGFRGVGAGEARAAHFAQVENYLFRAEEELCLIVQAETTTALDNLAEIAAVDGVDGVFIGTSDLSASMGYLGQSDHPEVVAATKRAITTIRAAGKAAGTLALTPGAVSTYRKAGATYLGVAVDLMVLSGALRDLLSDLKK